MKEGWKYCKLSEVCKFFSGFAFKSNKFTEEGMPIIRISDIQNNKIDDSKVVYFNPTDYSQDLSRYIIYPGEILIAMSGGTTGKIGKNETYKQFYLNQRVGAFRENKEILNHDFLYYYLQTKSEESLKIAAGAAQPNLSTSQINNYIIPVPPLSEQQRIVSRLDASFAKIDALTKQAEAALEQGKALFQAKLKELMEKKEGWEEKKFGEVCKYHKENGIHKGLRYIGLEHIEQATGKLITTISSDTVLSNTFKFAKGDVLYGRLRPYLKKVVIADDEGCCSTEIFPITSNTIIPGFIKYWFLTDNITNMVNATCAGCRMPRGNMNDVLRFEMSFPSIPEQQQIVQTLDSLSERIQEIQQIYNNIIANCQALKQALLSETFE